MLLHYLVKVETVKM